MMQKNPQVRRLQGICGHLLVKPAPSSAEDAEQAERFRKYCEEGKAKALTLGNRGPIRFDEKGNLAQDILDKYYEIGFYVFEGVVKEEELREFQQEFEEFHENAPVRKGADVDKFGRPVRLPLDQYSIDPPLSDPLGDGPVPTPFNFRGGENKQRHPIAMRRPTPPANAPESVMSYIHNPLSKMDTALRFYATPDVFKVVEAINGPHFAPFQEHILHKPAYFGASSAWHQDPSAAWDEDWAQGKLPLNTCGVNFHVTLYECTPENCLWMIPGSASWGRVDKTHPIFEKGGGTDMLPGAVPILAAPGDVYIQNRMSLHCAFANVGPKPRVSMQYGFYPHSSVHNVRTKAPVSQTGGRGGAGGGAWVVYDDKWIFDRCKMIQLAIDARKQKYPNETPYVYQPFVGREDEARWFPGMKENPDYRDYWLWNMRI